MEERQRGTRLTRYLERRVERKGLRPRLAAAVIAIFWLAGIAIFGVVEHLVEPEAFETVWLGMWWATQTVTTVGYGDVVPDDAAGQLIASVLMIGGLSFFAVITGVITSGFVARAQAERRADPDDPVMLQLAQMSAELEAVREEVVRLRQVRPPQG